MSSATTASVTPTELDEFYARLEAADLQPLWTQGRALQPLEPKPSMRPWLWRGETIRRHAADAGRLIGIDRGGDRRVLSLANPGLGGQPFATSTMWAAIQYLGPHESAPAHRHSQAALRFVLEGAGTWTTVNGDACDMYPGDLVLTPAWTWHDHHNSSDGPMMWFDGLDLPLVNMLEGQFFELYPGDRQPVEGHNLSEVAFAPGAGASLAARARPPGEGEAFSPLFIYRWTRTAGELASGLADAHDGVVELDFVSPVTGRTPLPTLGCHIMRLAAGATTTPRRKVGSSVFVVKEGTGTSVVGGVEMPWRSGDIFVSPSWAVVEHHAASQSDIFSISDRPALEALHIFREEIVGDRQEIVERFAATGDGAPG